MNKDKFKVKKGIFNLEILPKEEQEKENKSDGLYNSEYDKGRLLYRGYDPNNYIWIDENGDEKKQDEEMYRIISFEQDGTTKVIRYNSIGNYEWDTSTEIKNIPWNYKKIDTPIKPRNNTDNTYCQYEGTYYGCHVWSNQKNTYYQEKTLENLYNGFHYKWYPNIDTTILNPTNVTEEMKKTVTQEASINILLNKIWLQETNLNNYIETYDFYVGGIYPSNKDLKQLKKDQSLYTWIGKIGLPYVTDFIESSINPSCTSIYENTKQSDETYPCQNSNGNWLHNTSEDTWSITPHILYYKIYCWFFNKSGYIGPFLTNYNKAINPTFYLKSSVILSGKGIKEQPYIIENL